MKSIAKWSQSLLKSIQLQLFISFISLSFLIGWGLPISLLTPVSTLLFGPFLTCFLLVSSIIFFLELLYLPSSLFIWFLELITTIWLACLNFEQRAWLIGFTKPPMLILVLIPIIALAVIHSKQIASLYQRIGWLAILLIGICVMLKLFPYAYHATIETIDCHRGTITVINHNNGVIMIDPAFIASKPSYESYISYTLVPEIIQKTGTMSIDHCIVFKFNKRIFDALHFLATKITIKNIYIPAWKGKIPFFAWRSYVQLKKMITSCGGKTVSVSGGRKIYLDATSMLSIAPDVTKTLSYYDITYQPLCVQGTINNQIITL